MSLDRISVDTHEWESSFKTICSLWILKTMDYASCKISSNGKNQSGSIAIWSILLGFMGQRWSVRFHVFSRISSPSAWLPSTTSLKTGRSKPSISSAKIDLIPVSENSFKFEDKESCRAYEEETESQLVCYTKMLQTMWVHRADWYAEEKFDPLD